MTEFLIEAVESYVDAKPVDVSTAVTQGQEMRK